MTNKKLISFIVIAILVFSLFIVGCTGENNPDQNVSEENNNSDNVGNNDSDNVGDNNSENEVSNNSDNEDEETTEESKMVGNMYVEGVPIVKEKVSYTIVVPQYPDNGDFNEVGVFPMLEEETNVELIFEQIPNSGIDEKVGLMFATGDYPDALIRVGMMRDSSTILKYARAGTIIPLDGYIDDYCPNLKRIFEQYPISKNNSTAPDGHIYSLPSIDDTGARDIRGFVSINKKWLDYVGMDIPTTTDEYYEALIAFGQNDCNQNGVDDEIPSTWRFDAGTEGYNDLFGAFGVYNGHDEKMAVIDGKVVYEPVRDEYKEALKFMHKLYVNGGMDKETFTHDKSVYRSKGINENGEVTVGSMCGYMPTDMIPWEKVQEEFVILPVLEGPDGYKMWRRDPKGIQDAHLTVITDKCENPEILMRVFDTMNTEYWAVRLQMGMEGINWELTDEGKYRRIEQEEDHLKSNYFTLNTGCWNITREIGEKYERDERQEYRKMANDTYLPYCTDAENMYPLFAFIEKEDNERLSIIESDMLTYHLRMEAKFIMEGNIDEQWDEYVDELKKIGLEETLEIRQNALNR